MGVPLKDFRAYVRVSRVEFFFKTRDTLKGILGLQEGPKCCRSLPFARFRGAKPRMIFQSIIKRTFHVIIQNVLVEAQHNLKP